MRSLVVSMCASEVWRVDREGYVGWVRGEEVYVLIEELR